MKHKITAAILMLSAAAFVWQTFAQTDCKAACKAKYDECVKKGLKEVPGDPDLVRLGCQIHYNECVKACK